MSISKEELDKYIEAYNRGEALIPDETYDALLEEYLKEHGGESARPYNNMSQTKSVNRLVGTLGKVYSCMTPMREGQPTYMDWFKKKKLTGNEKIIVQAKFDGWITENLLM